VSGRRGVRAACASGIACVLALATLLVLLAGGGTPAAKGAGGGGEAFQTDDSVPARNVTLFGASPGEQAGEAWGIGQIGAASSPTAVIVRYTSAAGWAREPAILDSTGSELTGFSPAPGPLAGSIANGGAGALLGTVSGEGKSRQVLLVRAPGKPFAETAVEPEPGEPPLEAGEELFGHASAPLVAALDEGGGAAGALVVPANTSEEKSQTAVLHWEGGHTRWSRETIELPEESKLVGGFQVLAVAASSPSNAWLLARLSSTSNGVGLFHREAAEEGGTWKPVSPGPGEPAGAALTIGAGKQQFSVEGSPRNVQLLTVTSQGVWIDGEAREASAQATLFFVPSSGGGGGEVTGSWCYPFNAEGPCRSALPEALPSESSRSFAWANPGSKYGERVITGFPDGVMLRLPGGESFERVPTLGGAGGVEDPGATLGAAFAAPTEGWLGEVRLPVHVTREPQPNRLTDVPVPFRRPLLAIAGQPGAPAGALSSEALAVGEGGEVARYAPGQGWRPESLLEVNGRRVLTQLRAVAWPRPGRAYAVGTGAQGVGEMWLWRGETGLWERDPATPLNFRGNLLGIAFDPANPARGYAVGQSGVLLRYGKTWSQEPTCGAGVSQPCLPAEAAGASFTSIAFAGSEALVAFRVPHVGEGGSSVTYTGGILVGDASGWHVDTGAAAALGTHFIPWAVGALPDGGAALSASGFGEASFTPLVLEREAPGRPWQATPQPYPGLEPPGSLALFREGSALRAVGSGGVPDTIQIDGETPPPTGFPPLLIKPYPVASGHVVRQTASGWSDEEHERNLVGPTPGEFADWDMPYEPDPSAAVLLEPSGGAGWAVGGLTATRPDQQAADIARYREVPPAAAAQHVPIPSPHGVAVAIGGGAQCAAPCADRVNTKIGPSVWLREAIAEAHGIAGVEQFLYTGPYVTAGIHSGTVVTRVIEYGREFAGYAQTLGGLDGPGFAAYPAPSPTDEQEGSKCLFRSVFSEPYHLGSPCTQPAYYAFSTGGTGGRVRVVVLDDSGSVDAIQIEWLAAALAEAKALGQPAIVLGDGDLTAQIAAGDAGASAIAGTLAAGGASAYFYYAPEKNIEGLVPNTTVPAYGTGTLGYVNAGNAELEGFIGASGFLVAEVDVKSREPSNKAPVHVRLIPAIGQLALEAKDGTLLRRSQAALFAGLARRALAGGVAQGASRESLDAKYVPIPSECVGAACAHGVFPEYQFTSSNKEVGEFVKRNTALADPHAVLLNASGEPESSEGEASNAGLFCAFNSGPTTITITAGGLSASLAVDVQEGSVRRPCGTVPLKEPKHTGRPVPAPVQPTPTQGAGAAATPLVPLPAPPPAPTVAPPPARVPPPLASPFFATPGSALPVPVFLPPPLPTPAEPTPPSGTSAVSVEVAQHEEEEEEAPESVSASASAYRASEHEPAPEYLLGLIVLAAFAGSTIARRARRGKGEPSIARATVSTTRPWREDGGRRR
jgi:hypothetical protein